MECADLRAALLSGQTPRGPEVEAHTRICEACAELLAQDTALGRRLAEHAREGTRSSEGDVVPDFSRVRNAILADRTAAGWLRSRTTVVRVSLLLLAVLAVALVQLVWFRRADLELYPTTPFLVVIAAFSLLIGLALAACVRPLHEPRLSQWGLRSLIGGGLVMPLLLHAGEPVHSSHAASIAGSGPELLPRAGACFVYGLLLVLPLLALARAVDRGEHRIGAAALCAGVAGGLTANLALHLHCPITHAGHLLLGHATLVGALVGGYAFYDRMALRSG
jgi:hypothetical protein